MLQRPPPLMRIFRPPSSVLSMSTTSIPRRAAVSAASKPAAPAPTTTTGWVTRYPWRNTARNSEPYFWSFAGPTPETSSNSISLDGRRVAISNRTLSLNTM